MVACDSDQKSGSCNFCDVHDSVRDTFDWTRPREPKYDLLGCCTMRIKLLTDKSFRGI